MPAFYLTGESSADLSAEHFRKRQIPYILFHFELGGEIFPDDLGKTVPPKELYRRMEAGEDGKTSQISVGDYTVFFEGMLREGKDILHVTLSGGISGTVNSARIAAQDLRKTYPDRKLIIVDSLGASSGYGLLLELMADRRDEGMDIEQLAGWAETNKLRVQQWFFSIDLKYFIKGGRVTKVAGFVGQLLNICPLLNIDSQGKLIPREKPRGKKAATRRLVQKLIQYADKGEAYDGKVFISHSDCLEDARAVLTQIEEKVPGTKGKILLFNIGATIGCHTGPGTVAMFFYGAERTL